MYLDPEETKKKAWKAIYKFYEYVKPLLIRYNIDEVILALCGSVARGEAKCPRDKDSFCRHVLEAIKIFAHDIEREDGLPLEYTEHIIFEACSKFSTTDEIIQYIEEKFPDTLFSEIVRRERCSDVDGKIVVPDEIWEYLVNDPDYFRMVDEGNEMVEDIVYPLEPEIGFQPKRIFEMLNGYEKCEYKIIKVEESYPRITSILLNRISRLFKLKQSH